MIPIAVGLIGPNGDEVVPTTTLEMTQDRQAFRFEGLGARPVVSLLRGFSAPVTVARDLDDAARAFLLAHDSDPFARWQAGRDLAMGALVAMARGADAPGDYIAAMGRLVADAEADPAFRALCLTLPGEDEVAAAIHEAGHTPTPTRSMARANRWRGRWRGRMRRFWRGFTTRWRCRASTAPMQAPPGSGRCGWRRWGF